MESHEAVSAQKDGDANPIAIPGGPVYDRRQESVAEIAPDVSAPQEQRQQSHQRDAETSSNPSLLRHFEPDNEMLWFD
jgi:hypothetical protein